MEYTNTIFGKVMLQRNTRIMFNYSAPLNLTTWDLNEFNMPSKKAKGNQLKNLTTVKLFFFGKNQDIRHFIYLDLIFGFLKLLYSMA